MSAWDILFVGLCSFALIVCAWGLYSNEMTSRDRQALIDAMFDRHVDSKAFDRWLAAYDAITYRKHDMARMLFRDPWALYPKDFADAALSVREAQS